MFLSGEDMLNLVDCETEEIVLERCMPVELGLALVRYGFQLREEFGELKRY